MQLILVKPTIVCHEEVCLLTFVVEVKLFVQLICSVVRLPVLFEEVVNPFLGELRSVIVLVGAAVITRTAVLMAAHSSVTVGIAVSGNNG